MRYSFYFGILILQSRSERDLVILFKKLNS
jgi:hypothetical protein